MTESDPPTQDALFAVLANETRLRIVEALGDLSDRGEYSTIPFSELQAAVDIEDNGQFSYHLNRLIGHYVAQEDAGYRLRIPGVRVYQSIQTWSGESVTVEPFPTEHPCDECGEPLHCSYDDRRFRIACPACETLFNRYPLEPGSFDPSDEESLHWAAVTRIRRDFASMSQRMCPYCSGPVTMTAESQPPSREAPLENDVTVLHTCERCNWFVYSLATSVLTSHPVVISFLHERGVNLFETAPWNAVYGWTESVTSTDPLRIETRLRCDGDELRLVIDRELSVLESDTVRDVPEEEWPYERVL